MTEEQMRAELAAVYASKSWKLTAPLRVVFAALGRFKARITHPRRTMGNALRRAGRNPEIRSAASRFLRRFPGLHARFKRVVNVPQAYAVIAPTPTPVVAPGDIAGDAAPVLPPQPLLTAGARAVLADLRTARRQLR